MESIDRLRLWCEEVGNEHKCDRRVVQIEGTLKNDNLHKQKYSRVFDVSTNSVIKLILAIDSIL